MKQLTCAMCGSIDLIKQDGVFVCETCGTKYSVEEARKMIVEGTVEVAGTVKIDDSAKIANYYTMAESAYDAGNQKEAENYCNKTIEIEPYNYKAWLLKGRAVGWQSTLANIRLEESISCFCKAVDNAPDDKIEKVKKVARAEFSKLSFDLTKLCCDAYSKNGSVNIAKTIEKNVQPFLDYRLSFMVLSERKKSDTDIDIEDEEETDIEDIMLDIASEISSSTIDAQSVIINDYMNSAKSNYNVVPLDIRNNCQERCIEAIKLVKLSINMGLDGEYGYKRIISLLGDLKYLYPEEFYESDKQKISDKIIEYQKKLIEINPSYITVFKHSQQTSNQQTGNQQTNSGCYVATAVYGSYDCPQVWTLRRFRDYTLAKTWYGRLFIKTYYAISPTIVKWFGHTEWFKKMWKGKLDRMVANLNSVGVENTPYGDKEW